MLSRASAMTLWTSMAAAPLVTRRNRRTIEVHTKRAIPQTAPVASTLVPGLLGCPPCPLGGNLVLDGEAIQAALLAASGEVQALMNHLGLAARSAPATKLAFEDDLRTSLRKALQFGRAELVSVESSLANTGPLSHPTDVVVGAKSKVPQLAIEVQWHPRGEDHGGFAGGALEDVVKMAVARTKGLVEQGAVLVAAPARFWRWLPGFAEDRLGYELLGPEQETP